MISFIIVTVVVAVAVAWTLFQGLRTVATVVGKVFPVRFMPLCMVVASAIALVVAIHSDRDDNGTFDESERSWVAPCIVLLASSFVCLLQGVYYGICLVIRCFVAVISRVIVSPFLFVFSRQNKKDNGAAVEDHLTMVNDGVADEDDSSLHVLVRLAMQGELPHQVVQQEQQQPAVLVDDEEAEPSLVEETVVDDAVEDETQPSASNNMLVPYFIPGTFVPVWWLRMWLENPIPVWWIQSLDVTPLMTSQVVNPSRFTAFLFGESSKTQRKPYKLDPALKEKIRLANLPRLEYFGPAVVDDFSFADEEDSTIKISHIQIIDDIVPPPTISQDEVAPCEDLVTVETDVASMEIEAVEQTAVDPMALVSAYKLIPVHWLEDVSPPVVVPTKGISLGAKQLAARKKNSKGKNIRIAEESIATLYYCRQEERDFKYKPILKRKVEDACLPELEDDTSYCQPRAVKRRRVMTPAWINLTSSSTNKKSKKKPKRTRKHKQQQIRKGQFAEWALPRMVPAQFGPKGLPAQLKFAKEKAMANALATGWEPTYDFPHDLLTPFRPELEGIWEEPMAPQLLMADGDNDTPNDDITTTSIVNENNNTPLHHAEEVLDFPLAASDDNNNDLDDDTHQLATDVEDDESVEDTAAAPTTASVQETEPPVRPKRVRKQTDFYSDDWKRSSSKKSTSKSKKNSKKSKPDQTRGTKSTVPLEQRRSNRTRIQFVPYDNSFL